MLLVPGCSSVQPPSPHAAAGNVFGSFLADAVPVISKFFVLTVTSATTLAPLFTEEILFIDGEVLNKMTGAILIPELSLSLAWIMN